jgi:hypothetical protein
MLDRGPVGHGLTGCPDLGVFEDRLGLGQRVVAADLLFLGEQIVGTGLDPLGVGFFGHGVRYTRSGGKSGADSSPLGSPEREDHLNCEHHADRDDDRATRSCGRADRSAEDAGHDRADEHRDAPQRRRPFRALFERAENERLHECGDEQLYREREQRWPISCI